jgi:hypothetical protein
MTARQWTLNAPAAIFFIEDHPFDHSHYTMVISGTCLQNPQLELLVSRSTCAIALGALDYLCRFEVPLVLQPTPLALITLGGVVLCWLFFAGIFLLRKRPPQASEAKRDRLSLVGIAFQMIGYFLVWFQPPHQPFLPPIAALSGILGILFSVITIANLSDLRGFSLRPLRLKASLCARSISRE